MTPDDRMLAAARGRTDARTAQMERAIVKLCSCGRGYAAAEYGALAKPNGSLARYGADALARHEAEWKIDCRECAGCGSYMQRPV